MPFEGGYRADTDRTIPARLRRALHNSASPQGSRGSYFFVLLALLPRETLWDGVIVDHIADVEDG